MIDTAKLSRRFHVRRLGEADVAEVLALCRENTLFYHYCKAEPTEEQILSDMRLMPPGTDVSQKYYLGFYQDGELAAVMDLIDGYPTQEIAYIGFFMMRLRYQKKGIGSAVIQEVTDYLKTVGKTAVRLAIDKENPQSTHFWKKNGFSVLREVKTDGGQLLEAERKL